MYTAKPCVKTIKQKIIIRKWGEEEEVVNTTVEEGINMIYNQSILSAFMKITQ
jgi:hypothetical protein